MINSLKQIKEAEKRADEQIENSKKDSVVLIKKAEEEAVDIISKSAERAQNKADDMIKSACVAAEAEAEKIIMAGVESSKDIKARAEVHVESASKIIVSQILGI